MEIEKNFKALLRNETDKFYDVKSEIDESLFDREALLSMRQNFKKLELD